LLVDSVESMMMHGLANPKFCQFVCLTYECEEGTQNFVHGTSHVSTGQVVWKHSKIWFAIRF